MANKTMDNWDEIRTAYQVARLGTVSGAAEVLGVHHATVIRHIDSLENRLGIKLFQRHARGYRPTEEGEDLARVARGTDDEFQQMVGRFKGRGSETAGEVVVTSLVVFSKLLVPALISFQALHKAVTVRFLTDERLYRLEYGEAHLAVRAGQMPQDPDNVVQRFGQQDCALYASVDYLAEHGRPSEADELVTHRFVGHDNPENRAPFNRWMIDNIPRSQVTFRASDSDVVLQAVQGGAGLGFIPTDVAENEKGLVQVLAPRQEWAVPIWLVTHVDLHRTPKVQAVLDHLKAYTAIRDGGSKTV
jgi:DNA-binding transcriptional LysR family regulator